MFYTTKSVIGICIGSCVALFGAVFVIHLLRQPDNKDAQKTKMSKELKFAYSATGVGLLMLVAYLGPIFGCTACGQLQGLFDWIYWKT